MYAIRSYYVERPFTYKLNQLLPAHQIPLRFSSFSFFWFRKPEHHFCPKNLPETLPVITSYSIHYTKLYDFVQKSFYFCGCSVFLCWYFPLISIWRNKKPFLIRFSNVSRQKIFVSQSFHVTAKVQKFPHFRAGFNLKVIISGLFQLPYKINAG